MQAHPLGGQQTMRRLTLSNGDDTRENVTKGREYEKDEKNQRGRKTMPLLFAVQTFQNCQASQDTTLVGGGCKVMLMLQCYKSPARPIRRCLTCYEKGIKLGLRVSYDVL